jgi:hypothetical protein
LIGQMNAPAVELQLQTAMTGLIAGPASVTRTSCAAASDAAAVLAIALPAALVSRNCALIVWDDLATVLPGTGEMKPPNPYTTVSVTLTGESWSLPARSTAPAHVAVNEPTPCAPVVVTVREARMAIAELSVCLTERAALGTSLSAY